MYQHRLIQGVIAAAHTAGMQVGALVNTTSAAALTYSRFHESELTTKPILLGIIDVGHSNTQVRKDWSNNNYTNHTTLRTYTGVHRPIEAGLSGGAGPCMGR